ncbi:MAG TPA: hypothetical protein VEQ63_12055 [Bryobacteraceae bacterium]|nr:hypothetical protein [Bryobacteraceae bacterium]
MRTLAFLMLAATAAFSQSKAPGADKTAGQNDPMPRTTKTEIGTGVKDENVDYFDSMADYYRNSGRAVRAIEEKGIPAEEIPAVLHLARRSSASPNAIIDDRKAGKSWADLAKQHSVKTESSDLVSEANVLFLSEYHGRKPEEIRAMKAKGASWVSINQELRRVGGPKPSGQ